MDDFPVTLDGDALDTYCNDIDSRLQELLAPITSYTVPAEGPKREGWVDGPYHVVEFDPATIPSKDQREAFLLMRALMQAAVNLSGTLRYDVSVTHDDCKYHDEFARTQITRIKERICNAR